MVSSKVGRRGGEYSAFRLGCFDSQGRARYLPRRRMDQTQVCSARYGGHTNCLALWEIELQFISRPINALVTLITEYDISN